MLYCFEFLSLLMLCEYLYIWMKRITVILLCFLLLACCSQFKKKFFLNIASAEHTDTKILFHGISGAFEIQVHLSLAMFKQKKELLFFLFLPKMAQMPVNVHVHMYTIFHGHTCNAYTLLACYLRKRHSGIILSEHEYKYTRYTWVSWLT